MTLREMFPEWWCKTTFSVSENCYVNYSWLDFTIYEFIFSFIVVLILKWIIYCFLFILGKIIPDKIIDKTKRSRNLLAKDLDFQNDIMGDIKDKDFEFDEDVFSLEESNKMIKKEKIIDEDMDKEIETSIVNITRKGVNK